MGHGYTLSPLLIKLQPDGNATININGYTLSPLLIKLQPPLRAIAQGAVIPYHLY